MKAISKCQLRAVVYTACLAFGYIYARIGFPFVSFAVLMTALLPLFYLLEKVLVQQSKQHHFKRLHKKHSSIASDEGQFTKM